MQHERPTGPVPASALTLSDALSGEAVAGRPALDVAPRPAFNLREIGDDFVRGVWRENGVFKQMLGLCPALAVTTTAVNGMAMGLATLAVMVASSSSVSIIRNWIPGSVRIPSFIVIIATFVTVVDLFLNAFAHDVHKTLGLFIPLIVVNCIVLGRADAFAARRSLPRAIADALGVGVGFTLALIALGAVRELLGMGSVFGISLFGDAYPPFLLFLLPPGAFIALGLMLAGGTYLAALSARGN
ncbi:MAG: electron transport complex subunit RsxE [Nitrospirota bacterium]|nr:electron transport complex subunit RsxE [Nitrospirota bacterium]